jgi:hypothetical protein
MHYTTNELRMDLPGFSEDRTVNVLTLAEPANGEPFQLIVNRDVLPAKETLDECFERQVGIMARQSQTFRTVTKRSIVVGPAKIPGIEIESSFSQSGKTFHQLQSMVLTRAPQLTVLTLSTLNPLHEGHRTAWRDILASIELRI